MRIVHALPHRRVSLPLFLGALLLLPTLTLTAQTQSDSTGNDDKVYDAKAILTGNTPEKRLYVLRKIRFIEDATVDVATADSSNLRFEFNAGQPLPFYLDKEGLKAFHPGMAQDWVGEQWERQHMDIPPTISLNEAVENLMKSFKKKPKRMEDRNLPIPTDMEIDILKILWVEKQATPGEIYARLDTSHVIFADELRAVLEQMVERGFLDRKKISAANEFSLFGIAKIELSSKNRKNKQYIYWPIVTREKLFTYLDAKRFLAMAARNDQDYDLQNNRYASNYQKLLEKKLYRLFE